MLKCLKETNLFNSDVPNTNEKSIVDNLAINDGYEDDQCSTTTNSNKSNTKFRLKIKKKSHDICYTLNFYEKYGSIYFLQYGTKIFIAKISKITFDDDYQTLLEKGKKNLGNYFKEDSNNIPDITFWYQRYYYYKKFDYGIKMDYESWWSVTPEELAVYTATLCEGKIVADGFCGSGGNVIQFSKYCKKVYAIDIDESKLKLCKNNCVIYNCPDNIEFIQSDFLEMANKIKVDYVFLSPPWGGIKYKDSDVYNIKELMTPNIYDIIKVSLNIARNIIFYLPRTLILDELFEIMSSILNMENNGSGERIYFDVHVLKSAKKIKALMIIFGHDIKDISSTDLNDYLTLSYPNISSTNLQILVTIAKVVGNFKFLQTEYYIRKLFLDMSNKSDFHQIDTNFLINHFLNDVMTEQEKIKLKSFNIVKQGLLKSIKSLFKKKYTISVPITINLSMMSCISPNIKMPSNNLNFYPIKEIQMEYIPQQNRQTCVRNINHLENDNKYRSISMKKNKLSTNSIG